MAQFASTRLIIQSCLVNVVVRGFSWSVFTCKGCREVARLVGEVEDLRQMMESTKRIVTGLGLE